jgi:hypothetical protein
MPRVDLGVGLAGEVPGVVAEQIVAAEPAGQLLGEQARLAELDQQPADLTGRQPGDAGEAGGGPDARDRGGVQAEQAEDPRGRGAQRAVRPGEDRSQVGGRVHAGQ